MHIGTDSLPFMSFHEEDQFVWPFSELLGNVPYMAKGTGAAANSKDNIRLERRYFTRLNREDENCAEDNTERPQICLQQYIQTTMNCTIPWTKKNGNKRPCDATEDLEAYSHIMVRLGSATSQLRDIKRETGCQINCRTVE